MEHDIFKYFSSACAYKVYLTLIHAFVVNLNWLLIFEASSKALLLSRVHCIIPVSSGETVVFHPNQFILICITEAQEEADETLNTSTQSDDELEECRDNTCEKTGLALSRKISTVSNASCVTSDSVFLHDSPQTQSPASSSHSTPNHTPNHTPRRSHNLTTAVQYNNQSHIPASTMPRYSATTLMDTITSARKPFNPFPKPANGLLSAEKAKIGVKLGLYKPQDAMAYMSPTERRQFLKDRKDSYYGRVATPSRSSLW